MYHTESCLVVDKKYLGAVRVGTRKWVSFAGERVWSFLEGACVLQACTEFILAQLSSTR